MDMSEYQRRAKETDQDTATGPTGLVIPALGLVAEAGSLVNVFKKYFRDALPPATQQDFIRQEIGDVLWYLANIASRLDLDLSDIAEENLTRTENRYGCVDIRWQEPNVNVRLDGECSETEKFPDVVSFQFIESTMNGGQVVAMQLHAAEPNAFDQGTAVDGAGKKVGFSVGDRLNDNAHDDDGYRYHDVLHLGFMAVLGWSPVVRHLLRLKRKSKPKTDEVEDGNRARDVEEGLTSLLFKRAPARSWFQKPGQVDNETIDYVLEHTRGLEVAPKPGWLWKEAISAGFQVLQQIRSHRGGYVVADLNNHRLTYHKLPPPVGASGFQSKTN